MAVAAEPALEVRDLVKTYGNVRAVDGVSFTVPPGSVFCLLGPNGAGKTTTLAIAQGVRRATSGVARIFGEDPWHASPALKRRIGVLPQTFSGFHLLTVRENLQYFADVYNVDPDVDRIIDDLALQEHVDKPYNTLSGGSKQRAGIAMALVNDPELVFLDEPTAGVDPANRRRLWEVVRTLRKQGRAIVLTTHYMDEAERLADEVAIIDAGRIIAQGTPEHVRLQHGGGTVIQVTGLVDGVPAFLEDRDGIVVDDDGTVRIPVKDASEGPLVLAEIVKSGIAYTEIAVREPTLDDAFVRLVTKEGST